MVLFFFCPVFSYNSFTIHLFASDILLSRRAKKYQKKDCCGKTQEHTERGNDSFAICFPGRSLGVCWCRKAASTALFTVFFFCREKLIKQLAKGFRQGCAHLRVLFFFFLTFINVNVIVEAIDRAGLVCQIPKRNVSFFFLS